MLQMLCQLNQEAAEMIVYQKLYVQKRTLMILLLRLKVLFKELSEGHIYQLRSRFERLFL